MFLREGKKMTKTDACRIMIRAWEKLEPARIQEAFEEIVSKKKMENEPPRLANNTYLQIL